ncbi:MAG TPA: hypothetical protein VL422_06305, partial [Miltoncostaea sp.]|nr:hypothetical protein [Miltoncostaea sp.]
MENVPSFLDFLATHTAQRIPLRSDAAVSSIVHQIEDRARRLRGTMPLLFCAGEPEWPGFGVAAAVDPRSATMAVTIRGGVIAAEGLGWTARVHDRTWPEGDRLVLAYAGDDYCAVVVSRAAP